MASCMQLLLLFTRYIAEKYFLLINLCYIAQYTFKRIEIDCSTEADDTSDMKGKKYFFSWKNMKQINNVHTQKS